MDSWTSAAPFAAYGHRNCVGGIPLGSSHGSVGTLQNQLQQHQQLQDAQVDPGGEAHRRMYTAGRLPGVGTDPGMAAGEQPCRGIRMPSGSTALTEAAVGGQGNPPVDAAPGMNYKIGSTAAPEIKDAERSAGGRRLPLAPKPKASCAARKAEVVPPLLRCQVEGCDADLRKAQKDYHRRHKVCELHSKAARVFKSGCEQRFCQQCSRFHAVTEFDDSKRSCRRRLEGHNKRRRKPTCAPTFLTSAASLLQLGYHDKLRQLVLHQYPTPPSMALNLQPPLLHQGMDSGVMDESTPLLMVAPANNGSCFEFGGDGGTVPASPLSFLFHASQYRPLSAILTGHSLASNSNSSSSKDACCTWSSTTIGRGEAPTNAPSCALSLLSSHRVDHLRSDLDTSTVAAPTALTFGGDHLYPPRPTRNNYSDLIMPPLVVGGDNGPVLTMSSSMCATTTSSTTQYEDMLEELHGR